jgi:excisionase family DNA binding protein
MDGTTQHDTLQHFEPLLSPPAAAALLGIHEKTAIRLAREGKLPAVRIGKLWHFRGSQLDAFIASQVVSTCHPDE